MSDGGYPRNCGGLSRMQPLRSDSQVEQIMKILMMCNTLICDSLRSRGTHSREKTKKRTVRDVIGLSVRKVSRYAQHAVDDSNGLVVGQCFASWWVIRQS